jgi:hypothetical protein
LRAWAAASIYDWEARTPAGDRGDQPTSSEAKLKADEALRKANLL